LTTKKFNNKNFWARCGFPHSATPVRLPSTAPFLPWVDIARHPPAAMISVDELTAPLAGADPCGEDLSTGTSLFELDALILGRSETQFRSGEPPDWHKVRQTCLDLFTRSRDLRVSIALCLGLTCTEGLAGLRDGLSVLRGLFEKHWVPLHPKLDAEDNYDPLQRINSIAVLAAPLGKEGDSFRFIERLQSLPLTNSRQIGRFSLAQITEAREALAKGTPVPGGIDASQIDGAFRDTPAEELQLTYQNATAALAQLHAIDGLLRSSVGAANAPNLSELEKVLSAIRDLLAPYVKSPANDQANAVPSASSQSVARSNGTDAISSREDVLRALKQIRSFYAKHEPASPIPLLIHRIERMVPMTFLEILKEMAPDSIGQVTNVVGPQP
jgi:type VI secretion system protein ImpA